MKSRYQLILDNMLTEEAMIVLMDFACSYEPRIQVKFAKFYTENSTHYMIGIEISANGMKRMIESFKVNM